MAHFFANVPITWLWAVVALDVIALFVVGRDLLRSGSRRPRGAVPGAVRSRTVSRDYDGRF